VFIDCGAAGLAGRGGHGHNDCLSFEAVLSGTPLVCDSGTYAYTASYKRRNDFRSTDAHNTPRVDGREINRFRDPKMLWSLHDDARPTVHAWQTSKDQDVLKASHGGYGRLEPPVVVLRTIVLDHSSGALAIKDELRGAGRHRVDIPLHLEPAVDAQLTEPGDVRLLVGSKTFSLQWHDPAAWQLTKETCSVSPSYGKLLQTTRLRWHVRGDLPMVLRYCLMPQSASVHVAPRWRDWLER
jgi:uncharacterized heparinase superfamily protein